MSALSELASLIREAQTLDELVGSLQEWARSLVDPIDPEERVAPVRAPNYRQQWALTIARSLGRITSRELSCRYDISPESARLDLAGLCALGYLSPVGDKRGRFYIPCNTSVTHELIGEKGSNAPAGGLVHTPSLNIDG